ncbi:MAG: hypothetical protein JSW58_08290 [Candidatus Latescibacterota bacterium]|nr:MAG: hypothetical protein JSW58_08290 [Candidatus Latescibacterota bacterium]
MIEPRPIYELEGLFEGKSVILAGPAPSLLDSLDFLEGRRVIAVNSAVELVEKPWLWMYADKRFSRYYREFIRGRLAHVLVPITEIGHRRHFRGEGLWFFQYRRHTPDRKKRSGTWWRDPKFNYLPGRCSILSNAMSLCQLLGFHKVLLVGFDFELAGRRYYASGIRRNQGPTKRWRALRSSLRWFVGARAKGLWPDLRLSTVSPALHRNADIPLASREEAKAHGAEDRRIRSLSEEYVARYGLLPAEMDRAAPGADSS